MMAITGKITNLTSSGSRLWIAQLPQPAKCTRQHDRIRSRAISCCAPPSDLTRRSTLAAAAASAMATFSHPASAFELRGFLQSRQKIYVMAPIYTTQQRLQAALSALGEPSDSTAMLSALKSVRAASLNCYIFEARGIALEDRASLIQQSSAFADPCTFRLIAKNVTNLLTPREADLKTGANIALDALLRSFQLLDDVLEQASEGDAKASSRVRAMLENTVQCTSEFESAILRCLNLGVA